MTMKHRPITLKMIAEKAGVSVGTVDRAINNRDGVSEESKQQVLEVAEALGYKPNKLASALSRKKLIRIGIVFPLQPHDFYRDIENGILQAVDELQDYGVVVEMIRYNLQDFKDTAETVNSIDLKQYDGFAVNPSGAFENAYIDRIADAGIPVITFNTDALDTKRLFYIGNNSRESGKVGGELLSMLLGGAGRVTVIGNFAQSMPFLERFGGFFEYLQSGVTNLQVVPCVECRSDPALASESLKKLLAATPDVNGVFCTGYSSTIGVTSALRELGRRDIHVIGYDIADRTADALRDGWCDALLYQEPYEQGYQAARLLVRHILENWMPERTRLFLDTHVVLRSNLASYLNRSLRIFGNI